MPPRARREALRESNRAPFDAFELVLVAASVVVAAWLLPAAPAWIALLAPALTVAAIAVRRCRRVLRRVLET